MLETDLVCVLAQLRMAACLGTPFRHFEAATVLHYAEGEQITEHFDFVDPKVPDYEQEIARKGQRIVTFLVYLNDDYGGGETAFPRVGISHKGRAAKGSCSSTRWPTAARTSECYTPDGRRMRARNGSFRSSCVTDRCLSASGAARSQRLAAESVRNVTGRSAVRYEALAFSCSQPAANHSASSAFAVRLAARTARASNERSSASARSSGGVVAADRHGFAVDEHVPRVVEHARASVERDGARCASAPYVS